MNNREINGYTAIYRPDSHLAYTSDNWNGYVYEHRYVAEQMLGRELTESEIVHHLDCNKKNNDPSNLVVLVDKSSHMKLHCWIDSGCGVHHSYVPKESTFFGKGKPKCLMCDNIVTDNDNVFCSTVCYYKSKTHDEKPDKESLIKLIESMGYVQVGRLYKISDNAVRKWVKGYGLDPKTIKRA